MNDLLLTPREAAKLLKISLSTLWRLTSSGAIPCIRIGAAKKHKRYAPADLSAWVERQREARGAVVDGGAAGAYSHTNSSSNYTGS